MATADNGIEIELKFQVPPHRLAALRRTLATATAQHVDLHARYFDTLDGRLAAARMALRLRREGAVWVQTLKGQGDGLLQRLEDEVPRAPEAGDPPPLDLALHAGTHAGTALAQALAGGAAPEVRYGTEIHRIRRILRSGGARIEVALDVGDIVAGDARLPICEVEFELVAGPLQGLLDLAARWSARFGLCLDPATKSERAQWLAQGLDVPTVVRAAAGNGPALKAGLGLGAARAAMVAASLAHALPNAGAITAGRFCPDHIHQLRVALRRLRTVLRAFGPADAARDEALSALFGHLGGTRDADVLAQTLAPVWRAARSAGLTPPGPTEALSAEAGPLALRQPATTQLWLQLIALTVQEDDDAAADPPWQRLALRRLRRWHRRASEDAAQWKTLDDPARHALRKRLKRLRYLLEFAMPLLPKQAAAHEARAQRVMQEALGQWNDHVVARAWLVGLPESPHESPARWFALGWLAGAGTAVERRCRDAARAWLRLQGGAFNPPAKPRTKPRTKAARRRKR